MGSSVAGEQLVAENTPRGKKRPGSATHRTKLEGFTSVGVPDLSPSEILKIQAKAMKLSFTRDVELFSSTLAPPSTMHTYSFTVSPNAVADKLSASAGLSQAFDLMVSAERPSLFDNDITYYACTLTVYSHVADKARALAIRRSIEGGAKAKTTSVARAVKAASSSRKTARKIERLSSANYKSEAETEMETEAFLSETDIDASTPGKTGIIVPQLPLWLPFSLTLVSRHPLYELMADVLRLCWARHHGNLSAHSLALNAFLNTPAVRPGAPIRVPTDHESDVKFVAEMPGKMDLKKQSFMKSNLAIWPLFACLSADTLLTVLELALAPLGRVVIISQHTMMVSIAVEAIKTILEVRGWNGITHTQVHARDCKIFLEDPGPWILGLESLCRSLVAAAPKGRSPRTLVRTSLNVSIEICILDLDIDRWQCANVAPGALSTGTVRYG